MGRAVYISRITNGKVNPAHHAKIAEVLNSLDGELAKITIEKHVKKRSDNQSRYYFGVVVRFVHAILKQENPNATLREAHQFCKLEEVGNLLDYKIVLVNDVTHIIPEIKSTSELTTMEFEAFLERIRQWALNTAGVIIPLPNEEIEQIYVEPR